MRPSRALSPDDVRLTQPDVARSRIRFLSGSTSEPESVRSPILASWRRSRAFKVAADKIEVPYERDPHLDSPLTRSAAPVLRQLTEEMQGQAVSVILTDPVGLVLSRQTTTAELERHLDRVLLAPGFSYAEKFAGTNGIGTALEVGGPAHVVGHEHYAENLEDLACACVPIQHPVSGRVVGAVDLTCWRADAAGILLALAKSTAGQIKRAILADTNARHLGLLEEYLRTSSRTTDIVFAVNDEMVMLNDRARSLLDPSDQAALLTAATDEGVASGQRRKVVVELPSGQTAQMFCRAVASGDLDAGVVVHIRIDRPELHSGVHRPVTPQMPLPGLVGSSAPWLHVCQELETAFRSGEWIAVEGEQGVGKLALLRAVQLRRQPVGHLAVLDSAEAKGDATWLARARTTLEAADNVVVSHVDRLDKTTLRSLTSALHEARESHRAKTPWVSVTLESPITRSSGLENLLALFPTTVEVPPLRLHIEDLPELIRLFLARLNQGGRLSCSPEATRLLQRMNWPGNVEQVHQMLRQVVRHRRSGIIQVADLPPEAHAHSRRRLSRLESVERDAIVTCLAGAGGNKVQAAKALGMSRATIYRKIREYGIDS